MSFPFIAVPSDGDLEIHEHSPKQSLDSLLARNHTSFVSSSGIRRDFQCDLFGAMELSKIAKPI